MLEIRLLARDIIDLFHAFRVDPRSCGNPTHYEGYLCQDAFTDMRCGRSVTYTMVDVDENGHLIAMAGYISARASALILEGENGNQGRAAVEITQLAVAQNYARQGIGTLLVFKVITVAMKLAREHIGVEYVVVRSDPLSVDFYKKKAIGFTPSGDLYDIPRDGWNGDCVPLMVKLRLEDTVQYMNEEQEDCETA